MNIKKHCFYKAFFMGLMAAIFLLGAGDFAQAAGWEQVGNAGFSNWSLYDGFMAFHPTSHEPYVAFSDSSNSGKVTVMRLNGSTWETVGAAGFSDVAAQQVSALVFNPSTNEPYVLYQQSDQKIYVKRFNGTSWVTAGTQRLTWTGAEWITEGDGWVGFGWHLGKNALAFNPSTNAPYVMYTTCGEGPGYVQVDRLNGTTWQEVGACYDGNCASDSGYVQFGMLGFNPSTNEPYVAYADDTPGNGGKMTVAKFNGTSWAFVGSQAFSTYGNATAVNLAFHPATAEPYVSFDSMDGDGNTVGTVQRYDGSNWTMVGSVLTDAGWNPSFAFDTSTNTPYLLRAAYDDINSTGTLFLSSFDGSSWSTAESSTISDVYPVEMKYNSADGKMYLLYTDYATSSEASVQKYTSDAPSSTPLSITGITDGGIYFNRDLPRTIEITGGTGTVHATLDSAPLEGGDDTITTPYSKSYSTDGSHQLIVSDDVDTYTLNFSIATNVTIIDPTPLKVDDESLSQGYLAYEGADSSAATQTTFNINHTFINNNARLLIPHDTTMTKTGGGSVNITDFTTQDITSALRSSGMVLAGGMRIGIVGEQLSFSQPITLSITVSSAYNGQELKVTSKSAGESSWQDETSCTVTGGVCTFTTSHATDFAAGPGPLSVHEPSHINLTLDATLAISCTDLVTMGPITGDGQSDLATNTATCNVRTNNSNGYKLEWLASTPTMISNSNPADTISSYSPISPTTPEPWSINAADSEWGAKLKTGSTTYDAPTWGSQDTYTNGNWLNISSSSPYQFISRPSETLESGDDESILFGAQVGADHIQPSGTYEAQVTITATSL